NIGSILCRSDCSSSSPQSKVFVKRRSRTICRSESSTTLRVSSSRIVHSGPNDWSGNGRVMTLVALAGAGPLLSAFQRYGRYLQQACRRENECRTSFPYPVAQRPQSSNPDRVV